MAPCPRVRYADRDSRQRLTRGHRALTALIRIVDGASPMPTLRAQDEGGHIHGIPPSYFFSNAVIWSSWFSVNAMLSVPASRHSLRNGSIAKLYSVPSGAMIFCAS